MTDIPGQRAPVCVSRKIDVPAQKLFAVLAQSANHPRIDGSGMVRETLDPVVISGVGDVFVMKMHNDEMGDYEMSNHVVEYELNRRISWEPVMTASSRPEDQAELGDRGEHRWAFRLTPLGAATLVTESYDCSKSPDWLRKAVKDGTRWLASMTITLEKLDAVSRG